MPLHASGIYASLARFIGPPQRWQRRRVLLSSALRDTLLVSLQSEHCTVTGLGLPRLRARLSSRSLMRPSFSTASLLAELVISVRVLGLLA
jgi:hypothetical protein